MTAEQANLLSIQGKICMLRSQQVILDFDLAKRYGVETKRLGASGLRHLDTGGQDEFRR